METKNTIKRFITSHMLRISCTYKLQQVCQTQDTADIHITTLAHIITHKKSLNNGGKIIFGGHGFNNVSSDSEKTGGNGKEHLKPQV